VKRRWSALLFAMLYPTALAWFYFVVLARPVAPAALLEAAPVPDHNPLMIAVWIGGKTVQFLFPLFWVWAVERQPLRIHAPAVWGLGNGLIFGGVVAAAGLVLYFGFLRDSSYFANTPAKIRQKITEFGMNTPAKFVLFVSFIAVIHSLLEEYYWRWFVFGGLRQFWPFAWANLVGSVAFMSFHVIDLAVFFPGQFWEMAVPFSLCVGVGGAVFAWQYERTGSIYSPWLSHVLIDAAIMVAGYDLVFGGR
jgi:membrane protease YdiL (CAAX protease family)